MKSLLALLCTTLLISVTASAAEKDACEVISEEIIPLRVPSFDVPILWKRVMGDQGPDSPTDLISLADGGYVVVGDTAHYDNDKGMGPRQLYLARLDINGKVIWEKRSDFKGFIDASAGIAIKDRLAILSQTAPSDKIKTVRLDFFDGLGALKSTKVFTDDTYNLFAQGIASDPNKQSMTIAMWAVNRKNPDDNLTVIKQVTYDGKEITTRQYLPGVPNRLESFRKTASGDLIGSGQIQANGIAAGWIFVIDGKSGDLVFQRPYTRGYQSNLRSIVEDGNGNFIVVGDSIPTDGGLRAAWVMKVNSGGNPIWQKYVQGKYAFSGRDVTVLKDGRILALINARPMAKDGGREHVRLLTFTPQGRMLGDEALIEGAGAQAVNILARDQSRIVSGVTQSGLAQYSLAKDERGAGYDFWVLGLPKLSSFDDACSTVKVHDTFDDGY